MFVSMKRLLAPNVIPRSIRYYQKVKPLNKEERLKLLEDRRKKDLVDALVATLANRTSLSVDEWKEFRSNAQIQRIISNDSAILNAIKSLHISQDPLKIAESFVRAFDIDRNVVVSCAFIDLYAAKAAKIKLTPLEEDELIKLCNELVENEMYLLPALSGIICNGFCATKEWKRVLTFPTIDKEPVTMNLLIRKAMRENEANLVWQLMETLTTHHPYDLQQKTIEKYFHFSAKKNVPTRDYVKKMLLLLEQTERIVIEPVAKALIDVLKRSDCNIKQIRMNDFSGKCQSCEKSLAPSIITEEEFHSVREHFERKVVRGKDIYLKTTLAEWTAFVEMIERKGPFDVVIDSLNVAYKSRFGSTGSVKKKARADANALIDAVEQLKREGKRVLVIGRKHMEGWPQMKALNLITSNVFLVDNVSKDDIFLIYGAMHSGPNAYILSNDYMRNHKWAMGRKYEALFKKWQQQSTVSFTFDSNDKFQPLIPMKFKSFCHQNDGQWHVPFVGDNERHQFNQYALPMHWVCLQL